MQVKLLEGVEGKIKPRGRAVIKSFSIGSTTYQLERVFCGKEGCSKCAQGIGHGPYYYAYWRENGKTKSKYIGKFLRNIGGENNNMSFPTFDVDSKKEKINIFKIGSLWCFKYFFNNKEIFKELSELYNREKYRFEVNTVGERNKVIKYLEEKGFEPVLIEDTSDYTVKIDRRQKYAAILKNSIDYDEKGRDRIFIMKDLASVEEAIEKGAEKYSEDEKGRKD